ncbi:hypothetical protein [Marinactinospora thermotolerans]|nr:hypothetical protein [Marinactinospora thermotolerans]
MEPKDSNATQVLTRTGEFAFPGESWEVSVRERLHGAVARFAGPLTDLVDRDANEGDTRILATDFLGEALGYDKYNDLTTEYQTKGESVDYGVRIGDRIVAFLEIKRCGQELDVRSLRQARTHAEEQGAEWLLFTNGREWRSYHLPGADVSPRLIVQVDLLSEGDVADKVHGLFYLTKDVFERGLVDVARKGREALAPPSLAGILQSEAVVSAVRSEVRRATSYSATSDEILRSIREGIIPPSLKP